jgi:hypothetical protein
MNDPKIMIIGLCLFIALLSFKPSEPYLSQYLMCNYNTSEDYCNVKLKESCCLGTSYCQWNVNIDKCSLIPCSNITIDTCTNYNYCQISSSNNKCENIYCYENFSENDVNNDIYPWSTYAYLPFLLLFGSLAEICSYRIVILIGIFGRVVTRLLLIYGTTIIEMIYSQIFYSMGTAAEDIFSAYIYYIVPPEYFLKATSFTKASALMSFVISGVVGDVLVTQYQVSLEILNIISTIFVCMGVLLGLFVINDSLKFNKNEKINISKNYDEVNNNNNNNNSVDSSTFKNSIFKHKKQIIYLKQSLNSIFMSSLLIYWLIGNSIYVILYGYETSIYENLSGSNEWNGSILSIMLLAGSVGAMVPSWIHIDTMTDISVFSLLIVMGLICSFCLILFINSWELIASIAALTVFCASWQCINVVFYARLAISLKNAQLLLQTVNCSEESLLVKNEENLDNSNIKEDIYIREDSEVIEPPYSMAVVIVVSLSVIIQILIITILFSWLNYSLQNACNILMYIFVISTLLYVTVLIYYYHSCHTLKNIFIRSDGV